MIWKPIETAPRDGSFFIGANTEEVIMCNWPKQKNVDYAPGNWKRGRREWDGSSIHTVSALTHWMELPELPAMSKPLSPAAQAVLDGFNREARPEPHHQREAIAAELEGTNG